MIAKVKNNQKRVKSLLILIMVVVVLILLKKDRHRQFATNKSQN